jgi:hypothetical protein
MREVQTGRIGELICLLRLAKMGLEAEIVNLGTSDIICFAHDYSWRIQVKGSHIKDNGGNSKSPGYQFCISKGGRTKQPLTQADCDIVALVAIPQERVLFAPVARFEGSKTKRLKPHDFIHPILEWDTWSECMEDFGITPPRPNYPQAPDPLCWVPEAEHNLP